MRLYPLVTLLLGFLMTFGHLACFNDDDVDTTMASDCIITNLTLGTLNRYLLTKNAAGEDSTYRVTVTGSLYPMSIDHFKRPGYNCDGRIWNRDSLPYGTDITKVTFSAINATGGYMIRSLTTGRDTAFVSTDSTDFSLPRMVTVFGADGVSQRSYEVCVLVHKQEGDSMNWQRVAQPNKLLSSMTNLRAVAQNGILTLYGLQGTETKAVRIPYTAKTVAPQTEWTTKTLTNLLPQTIQHGQNGKLLALNADHQILSSTDGLAWTALGSSLTPTTLLAGGETCLQALNDGEFLSSADGLAWTAVANDEPALAPKTDSIVSVCVPAGNNDGQEVFVAVEQRKGRVNVWRRTVDVKGGEEYPWIRIPAAETNQYNCPALRDASIFRYDGATWMTGLTQDGQPAPLYASHDNGRTWIPEKIKLPVSFALGTYQIVATNDEHHFIWYINATSGEIWRGRHFRLGWKNN